MNKQFPSDLLAFWKRPNALRAWVSMPEGTYANKCDNCGGSGFFVGSIAIAGPYDTPTGTDNVYHYDDGKWWSVMSQVSDCPVCRNGKLRALKTVADKRIIAQMGKLAERMER